MTKKMFTFISETNFNDIPNEAVKRAKNAIIDCLGVALAGSSEESVKILTGHVKGMKALGESGAICQEFKTASSLGAWVNGTLCHALDYDDVFPSATGYNCHPTTTILPAVLALSEKYKISGKDMLIAYIVGFEVESRIGLACGLPQSELGWHPTSTLGSLGATAATSKLLRLTTAEVGAALGIASSFAGGLRQNFGTMTKSLHAGNAARNGVLASEMAKAGFTASQDIMTGPISFCNVFSACNGLDLADIEKDLGKNWHIVSPGISVKPYPSCRATHSAIDATLQMKKKHNIRTDEVVEIKCKVSPLIPQLAMYHNPTKAVEAKFSIEFCIAIALLEGEVSLAQFKDQKVVSPVVQELIKKIKLISPTDWPTGIDLTQEVTIVLKDGEKYSCKVKKPKGDPENPLSEEERLTKFINCSTMAPIPIDVERVLEIIDNVESLEDINRLMEILTFGLGR